MPVEFRLLGTVDARVGDQSLDLGHARRRCVLVALLVDVNRIVPIDRLLTRIWADHPPQRAREVLYSYLSRLRRILAPAGAGINRRYGGYMLTVDAVTVDLHRFHGLLARARSSGDAEQAVELFEQALALWGGEPFAGLQTPWLHEVRDALEQQHLAAELERNDIALRCGEHVRLLDALSRTAAGHPLDERLAGQHMLALYRCGRQADALTAYHRLRKLLANELGTDPSPLLARLHQQILRADPSLNAPAPQAKSTLIVPVPRQLPAPPATFAGRALELFQLNTVLDESECRAEPTVVVLVGTAGIGKTALALHWANQIAERFPDGQLHVNLRGFDPSGDAVEPGEAIRGFLEALGVPASQIPKNPDAQKGLYRSLLAGRKILIMLDNARDSTQVRALLPGLPGSQIVVTSRHQLAGLVTTGSTTLMRLNLLSATEAMELLAGYMGRARLAGEPDATGRIVQRCAGLPLALAIVAARAAIHPDFPLRALAGELRGSPDDLDALDGGDPTVDLRAALSWSYRILSPAAARLFRLLGLHPGPDIAAAAAASLAGMALREIRTLLGELSRAHLIEEHSPGRFTFHDLLRSYAAEEAHAAENAAEQDASITRMLHHYLHSAYAADRQLDPQRDPISLSALPAGVTIDQFVNPESALAWMTAEHRVLLSVIRFAADSHLDMLTWQLAWTVADFLEYRGHWDDWVSTQLMALDAGRRMDNPAVRAHANRVLGRAYVRLDRYDDAHEHYARAMSEYMASGDDLGVAYVHQGLALLVARERGTEEALTDVTRSLAHFRAAGHRIGEARALNNIGLIRIESGDDAGALHSCEQALSIYLDVGDPYGTAEARMYLGRIHRSRGDFLVALDYGTGALATFRERGDHYREAGALTELGDTCRAGNDSEGARTSWQQALTLFESLHHADAAGLRTKLAHLDLSKALGA
jgi:DNA-binding SARP family transcriptional activator/tetratricopeptide (TPR) repeat protein